MDYVPFTLFFMVCLMGFHGNQAKPYEVVPPGVWPDWCAHMTYCFDKPADYPTTQQIKEIVNKSDIDLSTIKTPEVGDRSSINECRVYEMNDPIYMIKDQDEEIRYVIQDPEVFLFQTDIQECHQDQNLEEFADKLVCKQKYQDMKFPALSLDKSKIELVAMKRGLPTSCKLMKLVEA